MNRILLSKSKIQIIQINKKRIKINSLSKRLLMNGKRSIMRKIFQFLKITSLRLKYYTKINNLTCFIILSLSEVSSTN